MLGYSDFDEGCCVELELFIAANMDFFDNVVVKSFLEKKANRQLLIQAICESTDKNKRQLDIEFKKFYFNIRFTSFISNTLYYNAINFDKRNRKISQRHPLTVDKPVGDEDDMSLKDMIVDSKADIKVEDILEGTKIEDYIVDSVLFEALKDLTPKQKEVIDLAYVHGLSDTEISKRLGKTQQAISKLHKKSLEKINNIIIQKGGDIRDCD